MIERASAWDITAGYIQLFFDRPIAGGEERANLILNSFCSILNKGYTREMIAKEIRDAFSQKRKFNPGLFDKEYNRDDRNILKQGKPNVMPWLNNISPPSKTTDDFEKGVYRHVHEAKRFYSEPIASMTIQDIAEIIKTKLIIDTKEYDSKRLNGIVKYLINKYGVEIVLFMVYTAIGEQMENKNPMSFNRFESLYERAKASYEEAKDYRIMEEVFYIVPKKRMLFN